MDWFYGDVIILLFIKVVFSRINFHLEMNNPEDVTKLENEFAEEVKKRGDDFKYFKDQVGAELSVISLRDWDVLFSSASTPRREPPTRS